MVKQKCQILKRNNVSVVTAFAPFLWQSKWLLLLEQFFPLFPDQLIDCQLLETILWRLTKKPWVHFNESNKVCLSLIKVEQALAVCSKCPKLATVHRINPLDLDYNMVSCSTHRADFTFLVFHSSFYVENLITLSWCEILLSDSDKCTALWVRCERVTPF